MFTPSRAMQRLGVRRAARLTCLAGAAGLAVAGILTAPPAGATSAGESAPSYTYSSTVGAIGLQTALFSNPEPSSVPDLTDVQTPSSDGQLDSFGTSEANGHIGNLNGLGQLPSLICLASSQACTSIPIDTLTADQIKSFPPPDPLDAHATYPAHQNNTAPTVGSKSGSAKVKSGPFSVGGATSEAHADAVSTSTTATDSNVGVLGGLSIGSIKTTTSQHVTAAGLTTTASAVVSNIDIGTKHLLHIGSTRSTLSITSAPNKKPVDSASSVVSNVTVLGKKATINHSGVHVKGGPSLPKSVADDYQKLLDELFKQAGFGLKQATISRSDGHVGHTVTVAGLELFFKHTVKGTPPVTVGLPQGVKCPIESLSSGLPIDPCAGIGLSLNAKYRGQIALGQVNAVSMAAPAEKQPPIPPTNPTPTKPAAPTGGTGPAGGGPSGGGSGAGSYTGSGAGGGGSAVSGPTGGGSSPRLASAKQFFADPLSGLSGRLWWFFPLAAIGVLGFAGRLRTPARFPAQK